MKIKVAKQLLKRIPTSKTQTKRTQGAKMAPNNGNFGHYIASTIGVSWLKDF